MKFKVGDKVRILDGSNIRDYRDGYVSDMKHYVGKVCTISGMNKPIEGRPDSYRFKGEFYSWDERALELIKPETIVIYRKDNEVIALDKSTGKKAVARCNPADTFDFMTGAKLAFERLTGEDKPEEPARGFKVGDIVKGKAGSSAVYSITNEDMTKGEVVGVSDDGKLISVKIIDRTDGCFINTTLPHLESECFERVEETKPQDTEDTTNTLEDAFNDLATLLHIARKYRND